MAAKICAFIVGLVFLFFGISGLFPHLVAPPPDQVRYYEMTMLGHWGYLYSWLPVNPVHNLLYIIIGGLGVFAAPLRPTAIFYCKVTFALMIALMSIGFLPLGADRLWGLIPLFGWNEMLHCVLATLLYYYGFIYPIDVRTVPRLGLT